MRKSRTKTRENGTGRKIREDIQRLGSTELRKKEILTKMF